ncbi:hypothetical protein [Bacillus sp. mrc49]|uniref:hypothetical protein n=1 Tax=Bacillus sp. mrc49 TaxID=2054913 RepID=UPI000C26FAF1|nr:hypothetical protein [Bacillus sp. mrc49]PJN90307.1 hypothetical protein CVN76_11210 [Bacillus sp. mrc49]
MNLFIYLFFMVAFVNFLKVKISIFDYLDEFLLFFLLCWALLSTLMDESHGKKTIKNVDLGLITLTLILAVWSLIPNMFAVLRSTVFLQLYTLMVLLKFVIIYLSSRTVFMKRNYAKDFRIIKGICYSYSLICLLVYVLNMVHPFMLSFDKRLGIPSLSYGFPHPAQFATTIIVFTVVVSYFDYLYKKRLPITYLLVNFLLIVTAGRTTSIGFYLFALIVLILLVYYKRIPFYMYIFTGIPFYIIAKDRTMNQFFIDNDEARGVLLRTSIKIATDYFPFGSGLGLFGSHASRLNYSPLYQKYNISEVWGLSKTNPAFITDSYWAMTIAELGFMGVILLLALIVMLFLNIINYSKGTRVDKFFILLPMFYALLTSPIDSVFVSNGIVLLLFAVIFMLNLNLHYYKKNEFKGEQNEKIYKKANY